VRRQILAHPRVGAVIVDHLPQGLLLAADLSGLARLGVEGRLRHLRIEFIEPALKKGNIGKLIHAKRAEGNCELRKPRAATL
jgi:hypothetical protein